MYTEIIKIIEGGITKDDSKVRAYAEVLAENLRKNNDVDFANRIRAVLNGEKGKSEVVLD